MSAKNVKKVRIVINVQNRPQAGQQLKYLFVTYCFGSFQGQTLIGVYKRGLRVAMALRERGHEITFFCTGREGYQDALTRAAETRLTFVDIPFSVAAFEAVPSPSGADRAGHSGHWGSAAGRFDVGGGAVWG